MSKRPKVLRGEPRPRKGALTPATDVGTPNRDDNRPPEFSFLHVDREYSGAWSWPAADSLDNGIIMRFLCDISQRGWAEIVRMDGGSYHHEQDISEVCKAAQDRITDLGLDQLVEKLFRLRVGSRKRLWGFVTQRVFYVLWWDRDHQVYPLDEKP